MKKFLYLFALIPILMFGQTRDLTPYKNGDALVELSIPISLAKSGSYLSGEFDLKDFVAFDSTYYVGRVFWRSNDTVQVTVALETKNPDITAGFGESWVTAATLVLVQANAGNDTLWSRTLLERGTVPSGVTDSHGMLVSLAGKSGLKGRFKVTFANPTTVGNSGTFRLWGYFNKP